MIASKLVPNFLWASLSGDPDFLKHF